MPLTLPQNYANKTGLIRAADFDANFKVIEAKMGALDNTDLANDAGIRIEQIANRYSVYRLQKVVLGLTAPHTGAWDGTIADAQDRVEFDAAAAVYTCPAERMVCGPGISHELCALSVTLDALNGAGVILTMRKNGSAITNTAMTMTASGYYEVANATPEQDPFEFALDGDVIDYTVERVGGSDVFFRAIMVTETWRVKHTF